MKKVEKSIFLYLFVCLYPMSVKMKIEIKKNPILKTKSSQKFTTLFF